MVYVGIDLHRKRSHVAVVDEYGEQLLSRRLINDPALFREFFGGLGENARFALEATYGWQWLAELLETEGRELHLAHPLRTKAIASAREDRRGRRVHAGAAAARRSAAGGLHCAARTARSA
jgi:transposase